MLLLVPNISPECKPSSLKREPIFTKEPGMKFPTLATDRLELTAIREDDSAAIFDLFSIGSVVEYYDLAAFSDLSQAEELIALFKSRFESKLGIRWAMRIKGSPCLIGTCGFNAWNSKMKNAVIGYELMPNYWGKGYAQESVWAIIEAAFSGGLPCGPIHRVQADTVPGNLGSEKLLKRIGFKEEGLRRDAGFWKNKFHDLKCFGLLKHELRVV
jgi:ribosomal-protein-alanine N-acetyltransferase